MSMLMQMVQVEEETPTCNECGDVLDEGLDNLCVDCQTKEIEKQERQIRLQDYAARRSQYSYLIHEAVMKANEIVIEPSGDWGVKGISHDQGDD